MVGRGRGSDEERRGRKREEGKKGNKLLPQRRLTRFTFILGRAGRKVEKKRRGEIIVSSLFLWGAVGTGEG